MDSSVFTLQKLLHANGRSAVPMAVAKYALCGYLIFSFGPASLRAQSGNDVSSAIPVTAGQTLDVGGDSIVKPHAVFSFALPADQVVTIKITRVPPWNSTGTDTVARLSLYAPGIQTVTVSNPSLSTAEVGDYIATSVLNYYVARAGQYYLDFKFFAPGILIRTEIAARPTNAPIQPSGSDISSAVSIPIGPAFYVLGDSITKPHAVLVTTLSANQLLSLKITRLGPWNSMGLDSAARTALYPSSVQTVQTFNPSLASVDVGDYSSTAVLNYRVITSGRYYLDMQFFTPGVALLIEWLSPPPMIAITSVNVAGGGTTIAQNTWIEIRGTGLAPPDVGTTGFTWSSAPEFASGRMPTQLRGVSVRVNGKAAYVYYISSTQINALTPLDNATGPVQVVVTNGSDSSPPFIITANVVAPSFFR